MLFWEDIIALLVCLKYYYFYVNIELLSWIFRIWIFIPQLRRITLKLCQVAFHIKNSVFIIYLLEDEQELSWAGHWYVSVVSIIFDCSMPIFCNFHILLATFYTIFGTNILIQCPVPVPVCCMFHVSQKTNIKRNPKGIKQDGELFWNVWDFPKEESTRNGVRGGHEIGGRAPSPLGAPGTLVRHP